ncbi:hypothetical protein Mgra_00000215 [Meloidogyne graminicola]|uniref:Uncharacterized protein n=1 Tax=Meloidogyne graminicola TaxID=189291 RepID=A0A8T0A4X4_9BILA|nr:hypothetical protein Mgra_00000215 [Meloidogyne graminicola]
MNLIKLKIFFISLIIAFGIFYGKLDAKTCLVSDEHNIPIEKPCNLNCVEVFVKKCVGCNNKRIIYQVCESKNYCQSIKALATILGNLRGCSNNYLHCETT